MEDEEAIAGSLAARLRADGFRVEVAHDGPGGIDLCRDVCWPAGTARAEGSARLRGP